MGVNLSPHPGDEMLSLYCAGQSDGATAAALGRHLTDCPECRARLAGIFAGSAADAPAAPDGTPQPEGSFSGVSRAFHAPRPVPQSVIPPALNAAGRYENVQELGRGGMG